MKVLLEATAMTRPGRDRGIGRYVSAIVNANSALENDVVHTVTPIRGARLSEVFALGPRSLKVSSGTFDVFHAPTAYYSAFDVRRRPCVVSILDVIPLDLPEYRQSGFKARLFHRLASTADVVLTLSHHAAGRISELLLVPPERVVVAPLPATAAFRPDGPGISPSASPYVAMLVDLRYVDPRKRASWHEPIARRLADAGVTLMIAGAGTELLRGPGLVGLGRISDEEWARTLRGASLLVYTSAYEGQGMPPLEAISCGVPVVAMDNTAIPEVVGKAGVLVPEGDEDSATDRLADAVLNVVFDSSLREGLQAHCAEQAARFSPERFIQSVGNAYERAVGVSH